MALTPITEGVASSPTDLNQIVNLLNGTTTNTQVTVNGGVAAQKISGYPIRYIGGVDSSLIGPIGQKSSGLYSIASGDLAVGPGGPFFVNTGNPGATIPASISDTYGFSMVGSGGYVARVHQSGTVSTVLNSVYNNQEFPMDTIDYDPRGLVQPYQGVAGTGLSITVPGVFDPTQPQVTISIACSFHAKGTGTLSTPVSIAAFLPGSLTAAALATLPAPGQGAYTGGSMVWTGQVQQGSQLTFSLPGSLTSTFQLDNTDSSRCYIAMWLPS